jgi:GDP-L-fucose synthase
MEKNSKILVLGHKGLVGSAITRQLEKQGYENIVQLKRRYDLTKSYEVHTMLADNPAEYVFMAAAKVGGINANNTQGADFITQNLQIQTNVISAVGSWGVKKLLFLGSSCIYPKLCPQPIKEEYLMTSELETTNSAYAIAKIAGIEMCNAYRKQYGSNFISVMPTNLYGINDNFHLMNSHVLPALIRKFHEAKVSEANGVAFWGTGAAKREFLFVDDLAEALVFLMNNYDDCKEHINIGVGEDITIKDLVHLVKDIVEFDGKIFWNASYPDGTPQKLLDVSKINNLGWRAKTSLEDGLITTYKWFVENYDNVKK